MRRAPWLLIAVGLAACNQRRSPAVVTPAASTAPPVTTPAAPPPANHGSPGSKAWGRTFVPDSMLLRGEDAPARPTWKLERVHANVPLRRPVFLVGAGDGSGRSFVGELRGVVTSLKPGTTPAVFLDITSRVHCGNEEGLFSIAFHPRYAQNGRVYACYTTGSTYVPGSPDQVRTRVSRFTLAGPAALDPSSEEVLLEVPKRLKNHNGGQLAFGPDGFLYVGIGDGGCCGDPDRNAQNLGSLMGKVLRLDVDSASPYGIPADNPFTGQPGARPEVWAYGFRNPWRFSFDRKTGQLWISDVGQDAWEEISLGRRGGNYGWPAYEGTRHVDRSLSPSDVIAPVIEYDHPTGSCVIGGYVYRGKRLPALEGAYLYADYANGRVWAARVADGRLTSNVELVNGVAPSICSFGEDDEGEVYLLSYATGGIYRLTPTGAATFPKTLSATGLFADLKTQTMRPELIPFDVREPLYSDHAVKSRHLLLPRLEPMSPAAHDGWGFPDGSVLVKHFSLERRRGDPATKRIVETRLLVKQSEGWRGYSYEWNEQGTDAVLLDGSKWKQLPVAVNGKETVQSWYFPSRTDCFRCHTAAAGTVLGPSTAQLDADHDYGYGMGAEDQLSVLERIGAVAHPVARGQRLIASKDTTATLEARARSYLHANCAHCHRPGGGTPVELDLRYDTPLDRTGLIDAPPAISDIAVPGAKIVTRGDPQKSVLYLRMTMTWATIRMPPVGSSEIDEEGAKLIADWIRSIP